MPTKRGARKMFTERQKWHVRKTLQVWDIAHLAQETLKRLTLLPQTQKSGIKEGINFYTCHDFFLQLVPGLCPTLKQQWKSVWFRFLSQSHTILPRFVKISTDKLLRMQGKNHFPTQMLILCS